MEPETVLEEEPDVHQMFQQNSETLPDKVEPLVVQEPRGVDLEEEEEPEKNPQTERRFCAGVVLDSKCYQFFRGPEIYKDAEYFCQGNFPGGHLASISSPSIHREVLKLILDQNGSYTRVWIGGYRLDRNHFIWMDESSWSYADWLSGEPNDTSGVEDCLEMLGSFGSGNRFFFVQSLCPVLKGPDCFHISFFLTHL
ncbi:collectin-11 [Oryzias melastigma]|uniref:collectin-11 n=1 Tax=Oryzias melastigma TaxID=30732 RepID=UPI00168CC614|nr:collectin-11 [Oryzias melastigma]